LKFNCIPVKAGWFKGIRVLISEPTLSKIRVHGREYNPLVYECLNPYSAFGGNLLRMLAFLDWWIKELKDENGKVIEG